jgi:hypothetical protein
MRSVDIRARLYAAIHVAETVSGVEGMLRLSPEAFAGMLLRRAYGHEVAKAIAMVPREGLFYIRVADALQVLYDAECAEERKPKLKLLNGGRRE